MEPLEVIGAFVDRERVDPELLKDALSSEEGRQYLVDLVALRELAAGQTPLPAVAPASHAMSNARRALLAAAVVAMVAGAYIVGQHRSAPAVVQDGQPAAAMAPAQVRPLIPPPPAPTTVIKLQPGVDWNEATGG